MDRRLVLVAALLIAGTAVVGAGPDTGRAESSDPPVLFITMESTRADHVGPCYGYDRETAPNICDLAADAVLFEQAYGQGTNTHSALPALLSGQHPRRVALPTWQQRLPEHIPLLPEILRRNGYNVTAVDVQARMYSTGLLNRSRISTVEYPAALPVDGRRLWWFMPMDPHEPFTPAERYRLRDGVDVPSSALPRGQGPEWEALKRNLSIDDIEALYDASIRQADARIGRAIDRLKRSGRYEETLIIVTADHGEGFGEHRLPDFAGQDPPLIADHGGKPYEEVTNIPLIIKFPGNRDAGMRVSQPVRHIDVLPTVLDTLGIAERPPRLRGRSLLPAVAGADMDITPFAGMQIFWMVRMGQWKYFATLKDGYDCTDRRESRLLELIGRPDNRPFVTVDQDLREWIRDGYTCTAPLPAEELYDLSTDPGETDNVAASYPNVTAVLRHRLTRIYEEVRPIEKESVTLDEELKQRLEDLGYLGGR